jgi:hypothetical protein
MITVSKAGGGMAGYYPADPFSNTTELTISYVTEVDGRWM